MRKNETGVFLFRLKRRQRAGILLLTLTLFLGISALWAERGARVRPAYSRVDLDSDSALRQNFELQTLDEGDYDLLFHQTGLGAPAVNSLLGQTDGWNEILHWQDNFFAEEKYVCIHNSICCREQTVNERGEVIRANSLAELENGDILVTKSSHLWGFSWRNGHAALVVDAEKGKTLEAITIGEQSRIRNSRKWEKYPNFLVLRLKDASQETRNEIAEWACAHLCGIPYRLTSGCLGQKGSADGTHCAHLIWLAYDHFGYDLDSNGGRIVTPRQIARSPKLEIVQVCGMDPDCPW